MWKKIRISLKIRIRTRIKIKIRINIMKRIRSSRCKSTREETKKNC